MADFAFFMLSYAVEFKRISTSFGKNIGKSWTILENLLQSSSTLMKEDERYGYNG